MVKLRRVIARGAVSVLWLTAALFQQVVDEDLSAIACVTSYWPAAMSFRPHVRRVVERADGG